MARLLAVANGNLTSSSTWAIVDNGTVNDSEAASTALTSSNQDSNTFVPGAITVDGVAIKLLNVNAAPSGTITMILRNSTGGIDVATVTINISDIPAAAVSNNGGWVFFYFGSTLLIAATNYLVRLKTSAASGQISAYSSSATNWSRMLRTTTTSAPAAADKLYVCGEWTAAATVTTRTVTQDSVSLATSYGDLAVCNGGTLTWGTTASTNYQLSLTGNLLLYGGGTVNMGTSGTPMPSTSSAILEFNCASQTQYGQECYGGTYNAYGNALTYVQAKLAADASAAATALTTDVSTGWKNGDLIAIAPTTRTSSEVESKTMGADASGTSIGTIAAITSAHSGTAPIAGELANLTRNVKIRGVDGTNVSYNNIRTACSLNWQYIECYNLGSLTGTKASLSFSQTTTNSAAINVKYCVFRAMTGANAIGLCFNSITASIITVQYCNFYDNRQSMLQSTSASTGNNVVDHCYFMNRTTGSNQFLILGGGINVTNCLVTGDQTASTTIGAVVFQTDWTTGFTFDGNVIHGNSPFGIFFDSGYNFGGRISNCTVYRNNLAGITGNSGGSDYDLTFYNCTVFGNTTYNWGNNSQTWGPRGTIRLIGCTTNAGTTLASTIGFAIQTSFRCTIIMDGCTFGATTTHSTGDIQNDATSSTWCKLILRNTTLASATEITSSANMTGIGNTIQKQFHEGVANAHSTLDYSGTLAIDTTIYDTTPSLKMTPNARSGLRRLRSEPIRVPVASGTTINISVKVRCSVVGDGTAYTGLRPRLILEANGAIGVTDDVVAATATVASDGAFETLTYTTPSATADGVFTFWVDSGGVASPAGWVNVDTITVS